MSGNLPRKVRPRFRQRRLPRTGDLAAQKAEMADNQISDIMPSETMVKLVILGIDQGTMDQDLDDIFNAVRMRRTVLANNGTLKPPSSPPKPKAKREAQPSPTTTPVQPSDLAAKPKPQRSNRVPRAYKPGSPFAAHDDITPLLNAPDVDPSLQLHPIAADLVTELPSQGHFVWENGRAYPKEQLVRHKLFIHNNPMVTVPQTEIPIIGSWVYVVGIGPRSIKIVWLQEDKGRFRKGVEAYIGRWPLASYLV